MVMSGENGKKTVIRVDAIRVEIIMIIIPTKMRIKQYKQQYVFSLVNQNYNRNEYFKRLQRYY